MGARDVVLWARAALSGAAALALEMLWMRSATLVAGGTPATTDRLASVTPSGAVPFRPATSQVAAARRAGRLLYAYALVADRGEAEHAARLETEVQGLVPEVVAAADLPASSATDLATVQDALGELRSEQANLRGQIERIEGQVGAYASGGAVR